MKEGVLRIDKDELVGGIVHVDGDGIVVVGKRPLGRRDGPFGEKTHPWGEEKREIGHGWVGRVPVGRLDVVDL